MQCEMPMRSSSPRIWASDPVAEGFSPTAGRYRFLIFRARRACCAEPQPRGYRRGSSSSVPEESLRGVHPEPSCGRRPQERALCPERSEGGTKGSGRQPPCPLSNTLGGQRRVVILRPDAFSRHSSPKTGTGQRHLTFTGVPRSAWCAPPPPPRTAGRGGRRCWSPPRKS